MCHWCVKTTIKGSSFLTHSSTFVWQREICVFHPPLTAVNLSSADSNPQYSWQDVIQASKSTKSSSAKPHLAHLRAPVTPQLQSSHSTSSTHGPGMTGMEWHWEKWWSSYCTHQGSGKFPMYCVQTWCWAIIQHSRRQQWLPGSFGGVKILFWQPLTDQSGFICGDLSLVMACLFWRGGNRRE